MKLQLVLWDWNGTLLDDVTLCVDALNRPAGALRLRPAV